MKRFFLFFSVCICTLALNAQNITVCNFDDVIPGFSYESNLNYQILPAPAGTLASGNMVSIGNINGNGTGNNWVALELDLKFDPRDYVGISLLVQIPNGTGIRPDFSMKLEQSGREAGGDYAPGRIQAWDIYKKYTGEGEWQEVQISFDKLLDRKGLSNENNGLAYKLANEPDFPPDQFDRIVLVLFSYYSGAPGSLFTMNIDDVKLCKTWGGEPPKPEKTDVLICDFDNILPFVDYSANIMFDYDDAPAGSPASEQIGVFDVPANNQGDFIAIYLNKTFDPRDYVGISFLAQIPEGVTPDFSIKLEQTTGSANRIQAFDNYDKYTGGGEWQEVHVKFDKLLDRTGLSNPEDGLAYKLAQNSNFPVDKYDVIVIAPGAYNNLPAFKLNVDDIMLRASWEGKPQTENTLLCNYDDVMPTLILDGMAGDYTNDADGLPASGKVLTLTVPEGNGAGRNFGVQTDFTFDPRDYAGISFLAKTSASFTNSNHENGGKAIRFGLRIRQTGNSADAHTLQVIGNYLEYNAGEYTGDGEWQEVHLVFDHMTLKEYSIPYREGGGSYDPNRVPPLRSSGNATNIWDRIANTADFKPNQFDRILVAVSPNITSPGFTLLIDDLMLRADWEDGTGIPLLKKDIDGISIFSANGVIGARAKDGSPIMLKVYTLSGQEIAGGTDQVQLNGKGIYIVKAQTANESKVSKLIIQ